MPSVGSLNTASLLPAPTPPSEALAPLAYARAVRDNFIAGFHAEVYEKDIVELTLAGPRIFVVNDPSGVRHVLLHNVANYRKARIEHQMLGPALGNGLILSEGATWRMHRRIMTPCFDQSALERYATIMADAAKKLATQWERVAAGSSVDICDAMMNLTLGIVSRTMFSSDSDAIADIVRDGSRDYQASMMFGLPDVIPGIGRLWGMYKAIRAKRILRPLDDAIRNLITERVSQNARDGIAGNDLLQRLISARDEETNFAMSAREVRDQVFTIFLAGHETTALALTWTWYLLSQHPSIEARLHTELDAALGTRPPCYEDLKRLTYSCSVIEEAMRLYPPVHTLAWREALQRDEICNRPIPRGSIVSIVPWVLHRHRHYWREPERFDPDRFASTESAQRDRLCYLPFGFGPRVCIGTAFAMTEAVLVLASLAQHYRLRLAPGQRVEPQALVTLRPRYGMHMTLVPRHAPSAG